MTRHSSEVFTEEAMTRPLFQEPTPEIEREDPFSGPQGFMLGGMSQATVGSLAQEYFDAANLIVEAIKRGDWEDYKLANAALFLYRHSAELILKTALGRYERTHDLAQLADSFAAMIRERYGQEVPVWIIGRIKELAVIDPGSTAFRYGKYLDPLDRAGAPLNGEIYVDLRHLQPAMIALNTALVGAASEVAMSRWALP
jgi:hypothetical protein